ncbi:MAG TPA: AraC family transcriptional regulator [Acidimicrobiia bacterium]
MRRPRILVSTELFTLAEVRCSAVRDGWTEPEPVNGFALVSPSRGMYLRRVDGREHLVDTTSAYVEEPGCVQQIRHPRGEDRCAVIALSTDLMTSIGGGEPSIGDHLLRVDSYVNSQWRLLIAAVDRQDVDGEITERLLELLVTVIQQVHPQRIDAGRPATAEVHDRIVNEVRLLLHDNPKVSLIEMSRELSVSPHHLSRIFKRQAGISFSRYRNTLRVGRGLSHPSDGHPDLAQLAIELGFADHAHFSRTVRELTGFTPTGLRQRLAAPPSS